ncbi:AbrB/MazE/SpoVT family DNA-binding domain-containing protein, partial [Dehalococcoidia bacterium]|nr:AbrB/MazE/SpoVT family DNA-binding domain-containing protein [Dehalococcoidia bacterium]
MPILSKRKLFPIGQTFGVTIPVGWVRYHGLKAGDHLEMIADGEIIIRRIEEKRK